VRPQGKQKIKAGVGLRKMAFLPRDAGETKMWPAVRENNDFFALAVRITGKLL